MKKLKIFISSVQKEFVEERLELFYYLKSDPLLGLFFEPFLFENLPASDQRVDESYLSELNKSDIYLGLLGVEYGNENIDGVSPTEIEYLEATRLYKTRFVFVKGSSSIIRQIKMETLINKIGLDLIRKRFNSKIELIAGIYASLVKYLMEKELIRYTPFDSTVCLNASLYDIDSEKVNRFINRANSVRNFPLLPNSAIEEVFMHLNLLNNKQLTNSAILLFGKSPQNFILSSEVKCAHFHGNEVSKPIPSYQLFKGDLFELVDKSVDFVLSKINVEVGARTFTTQVPVNYEIPRAVVAEAIVNAIVHRDYSSNGSVQIMLFSNRLEIWNPGNLPASLSLQQLRVTHGSVPFNPLIAEPMYLAGYIEKLGSGTKDMITLCKKAGLAEPDYLLEDGFKTIIWRIADSDEATVQVPYKYRTSTPEVEKVVLALEGEMKRSQIQEILQLKHKVHFRDAYLMPAIDLGFVEMTIPDKPQSSKQRYKLTLEGNRLKSVLENN
ncbi:MAG: DUF4062 domain-containing protein [bacterium]